MAAVIPIAPFGQKSTLQNQFVPRAMNSQSCLAAMLSRQLVIAQTIYFTARTMRMRLIGFVNM
ncbi:MAG TPA: hypothetical protein DCL34_04155 [Erythrobacter sp.]|nr:hypothetical protein [Erythrobacter sp.]